MTTLFTCDQFFKFVSFFIIPNGGRNAYVCNFTDLHCKNNDKSLVVRVSSSGPSAC